MLAEKNLAAFFGFPPWEFEGKVSLFSLLEEKIEYFIGRFREKSMFSNLMHCFILTFSQCHLVNLLK